MATRARSKPKRNPVSARRAEKPFPFLDQDYPVKPWINKETGERFQTISVQQDDGSFVATIAERPEYRFATKTRREAEQGLLKLYSKRKVRNPAVAEMRELSRIVRERRGTPTMPWRDWMKKYAG